MALFGKRKRKVFVLSLDGVPFSFLKRRCESGELPHLASLFREGAFRRMRSVMPPLSSVAWATYMTGKNPGRHGIYGFVDRTLDPFELTLTTSTDLKAETLWEFLSRKGKRVAVVNVPVTFPPRPVNGLLVGGFLSTALEKATHPPSLAETLKGMGYVIDVDPWKAHSEDKEAFLSELHTALEKRFEAAERLLGEIEWDYFHLHVMETDRINHFLWEEMERGDPVHGKVFLDFYRKVDGLTAELLEKLPARTDLVLLSDHGFCSVKREVQINRWLREKGLLKVREGKGDSLERMDPSSRAYSLTPGRIFMNLAGREPGGAVRPGVEYEKEREKIADALLSLRDPETGGGVIRKVFRREELYKGPFMERAADLLAVPHEGYDLKGKLAPERLFDKGFLHGTHTHDDAFVFVRGREIRKEDPAIGDLFATILDLFALRAEGLEGSSLL